MKALNWVINHQPVISNCDHAHTKTISTTATGKASLKENK